MFRGRLYGGRLYDGKLFGEVAAIVVVPPAGGGPSVLGRRRQPWPYHKKLKLSYQHLRLVREDDEILALVVAFLTVMEDD